MNWIHIKNFICVFSCTCLFIVRCCSRKRTFMGKLAMIISHWNLMCWDIWEVATRRQGSSYFSVRWNFCCHFGIKRMCRSQWPRGLRRVSAVIRLLGLRFRIPPGAWISFSCECCVLSGRGICDGLITRPEGVLPSVVCLCVIVKPR